MGARGNKNLKPLEIKQLYEVEKSQEFPPSQAKCDGQWVECALEQILKKTMKLRSASAGWGRNAWIVLWDRLGSTAADLKRRLPELDDRLNCRWSKGRNFSRLFIQDRDLSKHYLINGPLSGDA